MPSAMLLERHRRCCPLQGLIIPLADDAWLFHYALSLLLRSRRSRVESIGSLPVARS